MDVQGLSSSAWTAEVAEALHRNQARLTRFIERGLPSRSQTTTSAADILQEVALDAYKTPANSVKDWERWLTKAARSILLNVVRAERRLKRGRSVEPDTDCLEMLQEKQQDRHTPSRIIRARESVDALRVAIAALPGDLREVLELSRFEGLSHAKIAARLGKSEAMVGKLLRKGMVALRDRLQNMTISISTIGVFNTAEDPSPQ